MDKLTRREKEILPLVADGLTDKDIAQRLNISHHTVKGHLQHVFAKMGVSSRGDLIEEILKNNQ